MENASKALLIAGAILIAIVVISLGVVLLNSADDSIDVGTDTGTNMGAKAAEIGANITGTL